MYVDSETENKNHLDVVEEGQKLIRNIVIVIHIR